MSSFVKVTIPGKRAVYLINPSQKQDFIYGLQVDKHGEKVGSKGDILHLIQLGEGRVVVPQKMNNFYCELEDHLEGNHAERK